MNKGKKSNKKIIIIVVAILVAFVLVVYLLIGNSTKDTTQVISCSINSEGLYSNNLNIQKVTYVNDIFSSVEIEQHISFKANALKVPLSRLKDNLNSNLQEKFKVLSSSSSYSVELENEILIMKLNITAEDYQNISLDIKEADNITGDADNFYDDKNIFINQIESQGGECIYE